MYAIIETGGKQEKVSVGDVLSVERLAEAEDKEIVFDRVLLFCAEGDIRIGQPCVAGIKVRARILAEERAKKVISFKYRRRKSSRRTHGHRQDLHRIKITEFVGV